MIDNECPVTVLVAFNISYSYDKKSQCFKIINHYHNAVIVEVLLLV